jgi:hypothetical protein
VAQELITNTNIGGGSFLSSFENHSIDFRYSYTYFGIENEFRPSRSKLSPLFGVSFTFVHGLYVGDGRLVRENNTWLFDRQTDSPVLSHLSSTIMSLNFGSRYRFYGSDKKSGFWLQAEVLPSLNMGIRNNHASNDFIYTKRAALREGVQPFNLFTRIAIGYDFNEEKIGFLRNIALGYSNGFISPLESVTVNQQSFFLNIGLAVPDLIR